MLFLNLFLLKILEKNHIWLTIAWKKSSVPTKEIFSVPTKEHTTLLLNLQIRSIMCE